VTELMTARYGGQRDRLIQAACCAFWLGTWYVTLPTSGVAQKRVVDISTFHAWTWVATPAISNDGRYVSYSIVSTQAGSPAQNKTAVLQALDGEWRVELHDVVETTFTDDSRKSVFIKGRDSLAILTLGGTGAEYLFPVRAFRFFKQGDGEWLAYHLSTPDNTLVLRNLTTDTEHTFAGVAEYVVSDDGSTVVLQTDGSGDRAAAQTLIWVRLPEGQQQTIWQGKNARAMVLDASGTRLAFAAAGDPQHQVGTAVWYYRAGAGPAVVLADDRSAGIDPGLQVGDPSAFSEDGSRLFVSLTERQVLPDSDAVKVDVWSYTDAKLQSQQLGELRDRRPRSYQAVVRVDEPGRLIRLQREHERPSSFGGRHDLVLFDERQGDPSDYNWAITGQPSYALVSTRTGERKSIKLLSAELSPTAKYVVGWDVERKNIYSYEVATGITRNLTGSLPIPLVDRDVTLEPLSQYRPLQIARWLPNDVAVLIHDRFDIWQIDPSGIRAPLSITNGYGRRHNIVFRFPRFGQVGNPDCLDSECRVLSAFNQTNKDHGYYRLASRSGNDPELLTMGRYAYFGRASEPPLPVPPVKARDADVYLLSRESATESPNYFWTRDFQTFTPVSDVHPEKEYLWPRSELVTFKTLNGHTVQGILYKPGDFDPRRKYPVIIHYYEKKSETLNWFRPPGRENGELDITWFASHGYLVFAPDIYNTMAGNGQDAMNSVVAAANYLRRFPWVDVGKMGLQGHSFGGYYTNYIITQSTRFAAAVASSGPANLISEYGDLWGGVLNGDVSKKEMFENRHYRMNASLWERPDLYIKNSPILYADRVMTPLLMVANKKDVNVSFAQGVEFFTALRRLGKRVWMLQYDESSHGVDGKDRTDYIVRMTQFFDHYLKGAPAPKWMTQGLPARLKGIETGLELDVPGRTPGPGLLLPRTSRALSGKTF